LKNTATALTATPSLCATTRCAGLALRVKAVKEEVQMSNDFEKVKKQFEELAKVVELVNDFHSEGAQKLLIEHFLEQTKEGYNLERLQKLWAMDDYRDLVFAAADEGGRLREPRFVMEARFADETRRMARVTAGLAVATTLLAAGTFLAEVVRLFG
jgi:DNA repair exonuclease SbcCD ATPase subunit